MLLLGVSELKIHRESKRNSIFTGMLTFDLFSSTECRQTHYWEPFYILLHLIIGCGCLIVYLEGSASVIDLLPDIPPPHPHLSCPNVILLPDMVCQMVTVNATVAFPVVHICHFTVNIL